MVIYEKVKYKQGHWDLISSQNYDILFPEKKNQEQNSILIWQYFVRGFNKILYSLQNSRNERVVLRPAHFRLWTNLNNYYNMIVLKIWCRYFVILMYGTLNNIVKLKIFQMKTYPQEFVNVEIDYEIRTKQQPDNMSCVFSKGVSIHTYRHTKSYV